jgi:hypothetical protein
MHARLNRDRAKDGLPPLAFDDALAAVARGHSHDMGSHRFFAHDSPTAGSLEDRLDRAGILVKVARENLGEGPDVDRTQDGLLASPGHHANIMARDITHVGIGIVQVGSGSSKRLLVTQVFAKRPQREHAGADGVIPRASPLPDARLPRRTAPLIRCSKAGERHVSEGGRRSGHRRLRAHRQRRHQKLEGSGLSGVSVGTSVVLAPELYEPQGAATTPRARAIGIATAPARDARGRPAIKILLLVGT